MTSCLRIAQWFLCLTVFCFTTAAWAAEPQLPTDTSSVETLNVEQLQDLVNQLADGQDMDPDLVPGSYPEPPHAPMSGPEIEALADALATYQDTGEAPILGLPTHRAVPYGHQVPVVRCLPLRACDVAFEPGETLAGWALGDSERWLTEQLTEAAGERSRPHLLLKPTDYELATNLVVVTDRRTYHIELESPPYDEVHGNSGASISYDAQLTWWYPDDFVQRIHLDQAAKVESRKRAQKHREAALAVTDPLNPEELSFDYEIDKPWRPSRRLPWNPVTVLDDGRRVYILMPEKAKRTDLPAVLGVLKDGTHYPLNFQIHGRWIVVPTLFEQAELVIGTGKRKRSLTLVAQGAE